MALERIPTTKEWLGHLAEQGMRLLQSVSLSEAGNALEFATWVRKLRDLVEISRHRIVPTTYRRYDRGDVVWVEFGFSVGSELRGKHPAIVIAWDDSVKRPVVTVIPLTSRTAQEHQAEVDLGHLFGFRKRSTALVHHIRTVSKLRITDRVGHIDSCLMQPIDQLLLLCYVNMPGATALAQAATTKQNEPHRSKKGQF